MAEDDEGSEREYVAGRIDSVDGSGWAGSLGAATSFGKSGGGGGISSWLKTKTGGNR